MRECADTEAESNPGWSCRVAIALLLAMALGALGGCGGRGGEGAGPDRRAATQRHWSGVVTRVTDGDTLWVKPASGAPRKVRIEGIDAPESCQAGGSAATTALRQKVLRQPVQVATHAIDQYRREVATVRQGSQDVGGWMVEQGHAWSYRYRSDPGPYQREEQQARRARRGVFAQTRPVNPREFRQAHGPC